MAEGVKVTLMVHLVPAAMELPQLLVSAKSLALAPVNVRPDMVSGAAPPLVTETICALLVVPTVRLANVRLVEDKVMAGVDVLVTPTPEREE